MINDKLKKLLLFLDFIQIVWNRYIFIAKTWLAYGSLKK